MAAPAVPVVQPPAWARHVCWYHLHPLRALGAPDEATPDGPVEHRLRRLEPWLDHALDLGCGGLLLGPVFASETHGYDTVDHHRIDPRLGDEGDLAWLVAACHDRGLRLLLDGVFGHVGRSHPAFAAVLEGRGSPDVPTARWFRLREEPGAPDGFAYADFEGHRHLVALRHDEPAVVDHLVGVMGTWLGEGVDGWRLDAAYAVGADRWRPMADRVRAAHPDALLLGEVLHGDHGRFVEASGLHSTTQYELWKATWSAVVDRNCWELAHALGRHDGWLRTFVPQTFVGNHDVTRLATRLGDDALVPLAAALLAVVPGMPSVYAGDEVALHGVKEDRAGGDDAIRPRLPERPADLPGSGGPVHRAWRDLLRLRRELGLEAADGPVEVAHRTNEQLAVVVRTTTGGDVALAWNLADGPATVPVGRQVHEVAWGDGAAVRGDAVEVPPRSAAVVLA